MYGIPLVTQKARGVSALKELRYNLPSWVGVPVDVLVMPYQMANSYDLPKFARPCPERPRHGFVESRSVRNVKELLEIWLEARMADPKAEVILMDKLTAKCSAIATDASVTWGMGNAGVTSGGDGQWDIPCPNAKLTKTIKGWNPAITKDIQGGMFLEIVEHENKPVIVQMRDGPVLAKATGNFIPHRDYTVTAILEPPQQFESDLLVWEKRIAESAKGSVIVLPWAGLSSHFAVHGIVHGLAVVTGKSPAPKVGEVLQPPSDQPDPLKLRDYRLMRLMMRRNLPTFMAEAPGFSTAVLHSMQGWGREPHLLAMRIQGALIMLRMLTAACVGEARHAYRMRRDFDSPKIPWEKLMGAPLPRKSESSGDGAHCGDPRCSSCHDEVGKLSGKANKFKREAVFESCMQWPADKLLELADAARDDLSGKWGSGCWDNFTKYDADKNIIPQSMTSADESGCSYGGPRWRISAEIAVRLGQALVAFQKKPCEATWMTVAARYNEGVACGHNNGRLLDKFCAWNHIDLSAKCPQFGFMTRTAYEIILSYKGAKVRSGGKVQLPKAIPEHLIIGNREAA